LFKLFAKPLLRTEQEALIAAKLAWILESCRPVKIILFGSAAHFQMTDGSDIDLILIFQDSVDLKSIKDTVFKARPKDDWPHDLLFYTEKQFNQSVASGGGAAYLAKSEGRVLYSQEMFP
jgi:predicted nucleotidyltransferase